MSSVILNSHMKDQMDSLVSLVIRSYVRGERA